MRKINPVCSLIAAGCLLAAGCKPVEPNAVVKAQIESTPIGWVESYNYLEFNYIIKPKDQVILKGPILVKIYDTGKVIEIKILDSECTTIVNESINFVGITLSHEALYFPAENGLNSGETYSPINSPKINGIDHRDSVMGSYTVEENPCFSRDVSNPHIIITNSGTFRIY